MESGQSESVARAQEAAEERAQQLQSLQAKHMADVQALESKFAETKSKLQLEISNLKDQIAVVSRSGETKLEAYRKERDQEVDALNKYANHNVIFATPLM